MIDWLKKAVFYEIYPQSFCDSNGDGIGDFNGIISKLDYIKSLGANALWINPCFDSPFKDAGYDVRDYKKAAARYGTNEELYRLFEEAHKRDIKVLLDLVPGHTSEEHEWFKESGKAEKNEYSDRYIWTDGWIMGMAGHPYIGGECDRDGTYMLNFFKCQPALNFGFLNPKEPWQQAIDDEGPLATREAIRDVIRFWLSHGCDGFRVDMAGSLVKDDDDRKSGTCEVWRDIFKPIRKEFPEAAFIAEWNDPEVSINGAGFDMDFYLDHPGNGYNSLMRDYEANDTDLSFFKKKDKCDITRFLGEYLPRYYNTKDKGFISMITCNHDTIRPAYTLSVDELKVAYATLMTLPGVPFIYYGDEIGMHYLDVHTREGGYTRTGSRTPMQWDDSANRGFSTAAKDKLYLPVDENKEAPTVESQEKDDNSLLNTVRRLTALKASYSDFDSDGDFAVLHTGEDEPFVYRRGNRICIVNPSSGTLRVSDSFFDGRTIIFAAGTCTIDKDTAIAGPGSFAII
ncbi:MAG TPA: glycosylase [Lachnospiraceae bacterium]|nr:glycosylase [Lachnospiraceae bacterium]